MSNVAEEELRLSVQLEADSSGTEMLEMRHLLSDAEQQILTALQQPKSTDDREILQDLLRAVVLASQEVESAWRSLHEFQPLCLG